MISTGSQSKEMPPPEAQQPQPQPQRPKPECPKCLCFIHDHLETSFNLRFPLTNRKERLHAVSPRPALAFLAGEVNRAINPAKFSIYEYKVFVENLSMILNFCGYADLLSRFYAARPDLVSLLDIVMPTLLEFGLAKVEPLRLWLRDEILMLVQDLYDVHLPHSEMSLPRNDIKSPQIFTSKVLAIECAEAVAAAAIPSRTEICFDDDEIDELYA